MISSPHPIHAVIFDLGGVLIDFDFELAFAQAGKLCGLSSAEVRRRLFSGEGLTTLADFERGHLANEQFHSRVEKLLGKPMPYQHFTQLWNGIFTHEIEPTVSLARALHRRNGLIVGLLSNTNDIHFSFLLERMTLLKELKHVYASHLIRMRKPDALCFNCVLEKMGVTPQASIFVDDFPENLAGAAAVGMRTVHATSPEAVRTGLARYGVLSLES